VDGQTEFPSLYRGCIPCSAVTTVKSQLPISLCNLSVILSSYHDYDDYNDNDDGDYYSSPYSISINCNRFYRTYLSTTLSTWLLLTARLIGTIIYLLANWMLTSWAVIPGLTRGRAKMQKMVTPRLTLSTDSETDGHGGVISRVALRESVVNWPFAASYQLATLHVCPVWLTPYHVQTAACWRYTVLLVIRLSLADGQRWDTHSTGN